MRNIVILLSLIGVFATTSCSNEFDQSVVNEEKTLSLEDGMCFKHTLDSINRLNDAYIRIGKTRAVEADDPDGIILTEEEQAYLEQNEQVIIEASYQMFETIGLTKDEIEAEFGTGNDAAVVFAGLIALSATYDNACSTRAITGNEYVDCALYAIGLDLGSGVRALMTGGVSKQVVKAFIKTALQASFGSAAFIAVTVGLWGLCVYGGVG